MGNDAEKETTGFVYKWIQPLSDYLPSQNIYTD